MLLAWNKTQPIKGEKPLRDTGMEPRVIVYSRVSSRRPCHAGPGSTPSGAYGNGGTLTAPCPGAARSDKAENIGQLYRRKAGLYLP